MGLEIFDRGNLPHWARVRQQLESTLVTDVRTAVAAEFARPEIRATIQPGARVALTAGSRGIDRIAEVIAACVAEVRTLGAIPFIIPAMGSHGGATAEGSSNSSPTTTSHRRRWAVRHPRQYGDCRARRVDGEIPVFFDRIAYEQADVVIPVARVKPHTDFHGPIESGLMKMIAIGCGKQKGADAFHGRASPASTT